MESKSCLFIVSTPIGNLEDISFRALNALKNVDFILCEDTRRSIKLLNHFGIKKPLISYHKFNEFSSVETILDRLMRGETAALISDAGTPLISDPGHILIKKLIEYHLCFEVIPGANALLPALIYSGFDTERFFFYGFLQKKKSKRKEELSSIAHYPYPVIIYVAPHDLKDILWETAKLLPLQQLSLSKEISKIYEQTFRGTAEEIISALGEEIRGEYVLVFDKADEIEEQPGSAELSEDELKEQYQALIDAGINPNDALKLLAKRLNTNKRELYDKLRK